MWDPLPHGFSFGDGNVLEAIIGVDRPSKARQRGVRADVDRDSSAHLTETRERSI